MAKSIMIQGTMSNAGKSLIVAGLCRIFRQDGYRVAPFKSQNMALNSYITRQNLEIGRAQAVQAMAAGVEPMACMNPILLKPTTDMGSQVIINGEVVGNMRAMDYFRHKKEYIPIIREAYEKLAGEYDIIVLEGAGSPAEINLKQDDIVNMGMAAIADAPVLLVGDIDRGGVFAQLIGTVLLLEEEEQERVKGLIINKFRGDKTILEPGLSMITERCGKEVLGVVPYLDVDIEDEDSLSEALHRQSVKEGVDIAVIRLPRISNFTDFQALSLEECLSVRYVERPSQLGSPDLVVLPGTKSTMRDLKWLRESGLEGKILRLAQQGTPVLGICGGYQMLGEWLEDVCGVEEGGRMKGMGLLPVSTSFSPRKTRSRVEGKIGPLSGLFAPLAGKRVGGYEIHMGQSSVATGGVPFAFLRQEEAVDSAALDGVALDESSSGFRDGCAAGSVLGTYVHGLFDGKEFREAFARLLCERKGIPYGTGDPDGATSYEVYREKQFDKLADGLRGSLDMRRIYEIMGLPIKG